MPNQVHPYDQLSALCANHHATLVVVSKTRTIEEIDALYQMGQRIFAENRVQELMEKAPYLPKDIEWHLIGHLQTNKVKGVLPLVTCIHSLDRLSLWEKLQNEAADADRKINCLLQIKIAREETKFGWIFEELEEMLSAGIHLQYPNIILNGVMGMASLSEDKDLVRQEMRGLKNKFAILKAKHFAEDPAFTSISMGMSGDYTIALEEGSTIIRIGSLLFP